MFIASKSLERIERFKKDFNKHFEITDLGETTWILGLEIIRDRSKRTLEVSQRKYIEEVLRRFKMDKCRPCSTPMSANQTFKRVDSPEIDITRYQKAIGSLMYAMLGTRADLAHSVGVLSQFSSCPSKAHWNGVMRVFRYLRKTANVTLKYQGTSNELQVTGYSDSDYAGDPNTRRSISGNVFIVSNAAISWCSNKQSVVALSSTEAEYVAAAHATKQAMWLTTLLNELDLQPNPVPITLLLDNQSCMDLAYNPIHHKRSKHIDVRHHYLRERVEEGDIELEYVPTGDQLADPFTKQLPRERHETHFKAMGLTL
jgi:hypothetical protein